MNFELGIFARTWPNASIGEVFGRMSRLGLKKVHLNPSYLITASGDYMDAASLNKLCETYGVASCGISGTFNIIQRERKDYLNFEKIVKLAASLSIPMVSISTGTFSTESMWTASEKNHTPYAWASMLEAVERLLRISEQYGVSLGVEPEPGNIVSDHILARRLLDAFPGAKMGIIMDAANLIAGKPIESHYGILQDAFDMLGSDIICAHAKDWSEASGFTAAGKGCLNYRVYLQLLASAGYHGPLVLHQLSDLDVADSIRHIESLSEAKDG